MDELIEIDWETIGKYMDTHSCFHTASVATLLNIGAWNYIIFTTKKKIKNSYSKIHDMALIHMTHKIL